MPHYSSRRHGPTDTNLRFGKRLPDALRRPDLPASSVRLSDGVTDALNELGYDIVPPTTGPASPTADAAIRRRLVVQLSVNDVSPSCPAQQPNRLAGATQAVCDLRRQVRPRRSAISAAQTSSSRSTRSTEPDRARPREEHRRMGVATALCRETAAWMIELGFETDLDRPFRGAGRRRRAPLVPRARLSQARRRDVRRCSDDDRRWQRRAAGLTQTFLTPVSYSYRGSGIGVKLRCTRRDRQRRRRT